MRLAVNLSALQLRGDALVDSVRLALAGAGLPAERLELEVTETVLVQDNDQVRRGQVLATLDTARLSDQVENASAPAQKTRNLRVTRVATGLHQQLQGAFCVLHVLADEAQE